MEKQPIKIAVIGPESTGKSTLAAQLAKHFNTLWVPEYARYYCSYLKEEPNLQDEINMFYGQMALEDSILPLAKQLLICDVTILNIKIWCDEMFGGCPDFVLSEIRERPYDLYLLMDIDMPWEYDPLRDFPHRRRYFFDLYQKELDALKANYKVVNGLNNERFQNALAVIKAFITN